MTFVGKILVILIMAFSLVFLGVSTVVFTTATDWKSQAEKQKTEVGKLQGNIRDASAKVTDAEQKLDVAKKEHKTQLDEKNARVADLTKQVADATKDMNDTRAQIGIAQNNAQVSLAEATARKVEVDTLNETLGKAQTQANQFNEQNIKLIDRIRILEREKATAEANAKDLRSTTARFMAYLREHNISLDSLKKYDATDVPPDVEGKVVELNPTRRSMEISIGSDDGIAVGQTLFVSRHDPKPEFLGKVKIVAVYPDKAVADVIPPAINGKKIQEGDIVSSTLNPR